MMNRFHQTSSMASSIGSMTFLVPLLLILIIATSEMATAIYAPCLPMVAGYFNITEAQIQGTMSINLVGLALSGLFYGPLSDSFGRRYALRLGMGLFLLGSIGCMLTSSFEVLMLFRFIQGIGAGVSVVVSFAVVQDLFDEKGTAVVLSYMGMAISLSPGLAPILGSALASSYGWKMCFGAVSIAAFIIMLLLFFVMPETLALNKRSSFSMMGMVRAYGKALKNVRFMAASLIPGFMIGGLWAWMTSTPVLFINYLEVPLEDYGYYGFFAVTMYIMGTLMNSRLVNNFTLRSLLIVGVGLSLMSSILLMGAGQLGINNAILLQGLQAPFAIGLAFIIPNGTALAFAEIKEGQGTCSALLGSLEMILGAVCVAAVGEIFNGTVTSIAILMVITSLLSLVLCYTSSK